MKKILLTITICMFAKAGYCAAPTLFYSDLTSGPKTGGQTEGAFVTIWGRNFGASQGASYVTCCGAQANSYPVWNDTEVTFEIDSTAADGAGTISLTTTEGTSNTLAFTIRSGNIYFVDDDASPGGDGSYASMWDSPNDFYNNLTAGDICYIKAGSYTGEYGYPGWNSNICTDDTKTGTEASPVAWVGYPGETATFSGQTYGFRYRDSCDYWVISNLGITPNSNGITTGGTGWRIIGNLIDLNNGGQYEGIGGGGTSTKIYGNEITNGNGDNLLHCVYMGYGHTDFDIGWNYGHDNDMGFQIQVHQDGGEYTFSGKIHDNYLDCGTSSRGITVSESAAGTEVDIYNNIITEGAYSGYGAINVQDADADVDIYNNTVYCVINNIPGVFINGGGSGEIRNNIFYLHDSVEYIAEANGGDRDNFTISNNCFYGSSADTYGTSKVEASPSFISAGSNFHIGASSPCINTGADTTAIVVTDYDGITRVTNYVDIGVYEYISGDTTAPGTTSDLAASTGTNSGEVDLTWTAPGDDNTTGTASSYNIRYAAAAIDTDEKFNAATQASGEPTPSVAGSSESMTVTSLTPGDTYYFALKTSDEVPNTSSLSNSPSAAAKQAGGGYSLSGGGYTITGGTI